MKSLICLLSCCLLATVSSGGEPTFADLVQKASQRFTRVDDSIALLTQAIELEPKNPQGYELRGSMYQAIRQHDAAIADFSRALELEPENAGVWNRRGSERLATGEFKKAIADFDKYLELEPAAERSHWKRGIAYYYAGEYDKGKRQFEAYQTFDDADVENAVWRFLCMARASGLKKAQQEILKIGDDRRVPMRQIYELFAGKLQPEDVLTAAKAGDPGEAELNNRLFYAHLYLGLYYDALKQPAKAKQHLDLAADKHQIGHYMWDIARVHADLFKEDDD